MIPPLFPSSKPVILLQLDQLRQLFFLHYSALTLSSNLYGSCAQMPSSAETILLASCLSKNRSVPLSPLLPRQHFAATFPRRSVGHRVVRACPGGRRDCSEIMALANFLPTSCQVASCPDDTVIAKRGRMFWNLSAGTSTCTWCLPLPFVTFTNFWLEDRSLKWKKAKRVNCFRKGNVQQIQACITDPRICGLICGMRMVLVSVPKNNFTTDASVTFGERFHSQSNKPAIGFEVCDKMAALT